MADDRPVLRVGDAERESTAALLRRHATDGRLTLDELDERLGQAYGAKTAADLNQLLADLPDIRPEVELIKPSDKPATTRERIPEECARGRPGFNRVIWGSWASVSALNLLIWGIVCLATLGFVYPWWVWVAGPWGAVLLSREIQMRVHRREIEG
jgi:hypothetical protein